MSLPPPSMPRPPSLVGDVGVPERVLPKRQPSVPREPLEVRAGELPENRKRAGAVRVDGVVVHPAEAGHAAVQVEALGNDLRALP